MFSYFIRCISEIYRFALELKRVRLPCESQLSSNINQSKNAPPKLRLLWHSVAPWIASGYGTTTREVCTRLQKYGFEIIISAYYGAEPGGVPPYQVPVLPSKDGPFGIASAAQYCKQHHVNAGVLFTEFRGALTDTLNLTVTETVNKKMHICVMGTLSIRKNYLNDWVVRFKDDNAVNFL